MRAISVPIETLSPTFATTSARAPAIGEGTSIVALSDSSVISDCSAFTDVARLDQDLDNRNVLEIADIGNFHVDFRHRRSPQATKVEWDGDAQLRAGFGPSGSMPYFAIASATRLVGSNCSSASAFRLATAT